MKCSDFAQAPRYRTCSFMGCSFPCKRRGTLCEMRLINSIAHARAIGATRTSSNSLVIDLSHSFCTLRCACAKMALHTVPHEREAMHIDWNNNQAAIWRPLKQYLRPVRHADPVRLDDLEGIEQQKEQLARNTQRFLDGQPANNALLWGARGTGMSSLIKAILNRYAESGLRLIEVDLFVLFVLFVFVVVFFFLLFFFFFF